MCRGSLLQEADLLHFSDNYVVLVLHREMLISENISLAIDTIHKIFLDWMG